MSLIFVHFLILQGFGFFMVAVGSFIFAHLGLLLIGRIDAFLSSENSTSSQVRPSTKRTLTN
ncbi:MAG TPA: hypothetical protein VGM64_19605 [Lacunisphaera sp.]